MRLYSGVIVGAAGYREATAFISDNGSLRSIIGSISQMQMANNANAQSHPNGMSSIINNTNELRAALVATHQQLAALA